MKFYIQNKIPNSQAVGACFKFEKKTTRAVLSIERSQYTWSKCEKKSIKFMAQDGHKTSQCIIPALS